jgi:hypothetical protein
LRRPSGRTHRRLVPAGAGGWHGRSADRSGAYRGDPADLRRRYGPSDLPIHHLLRGADGLPRGADEPHLGQDRRDGPGGSPPGHPRRADDGLAGRRPRDRHGHPGR